MAKAEIIKKNPAQVELEAGNSVQMIFQHCRELAQSKDAKEWFGIMPAETK